ncbi:MAG: inositol monophosphatase [Elusimicrobia bacterium CG11_big_fil_rev_8_21_14_0_20_64_6]|nr:MAG: inositol monophosphatase [Elusimicrobia bacterium CG11_big_fil_rev_8_21_14_0_20_64_6]
MTRAELLKTALLRAGGVLRRHFGKVSYKQKRRADLLTIADLNSQKTILDAIRRAFPGDDYKAEEDEVKLTGAEHLWIIDPLDGTTNYAHGYPAACVSIGVLKSGTANLGGIYDPFRDELFLARKGAGARLNGKKMAVSRTGRISDSLLITGFAYDRAEKADYYLSHFKAFMTKCHDIRRSGSAALDMAWVAAGRADGFWELELNPWDVAAGLLLIQEAGGVVTDFNGRPWQDWKTMGKRTLATNGRVHKEMIGILRKTK